MPKQLTPGKWRGLKTTSTDHHAFSVLAFDQRGSYRSMLPPETPFTVASHIKKDVTVALAPLASAVLLDPIYGLEAALSLPHSSGMLMAVEKSGYSGDSDYRRVEFIPGWHVDKIKGMGASAVKLLVYYHPEAGELAQEIEDVILQVSKACQEHDIALFVEPVSYSLDASLPKSSPEFASARPEIIRETARRLSVLDIDVLKLEFPVDTQFNSDHHEWARACEAISQVSQVPWALLSAGVDFATFTSQIEIACKSGASGIVAGRTIWQECVTMTPGERQHFLETVASERLCSLHNIVDAHARPWTDYYQPVAPAEDWFESYLNRS